MKKFKIALAALALIAGVVLFSAFRVETSATSQQKVNDHLYFRYLGDDNVEIDFEDELLWEFLGDEQPGSICGIGNVACVVELTPVDNPAISASDPASIVIADFVAFLQNQGAGGTSYTNAMDFVDENTLQHKSDN